MPEDFKTYVSRLYSHAAKHMNMLSEALTNEEYDTADFLVQVIILDLTKLREIVNTQLRFSKK